MKKTYHAEEYKASKKGYSSEYTWIIVDGSEVKGCARGNHYAGCSCRNSDRALSCTEECAAKCVKEVIECLSDKDRLEIGNVKFKEPAPEEIEKRLSKRNQERALSLKRTIETACMCHGLDLTLYGGGIGVVDPISRKIIMVWKPLLKMEDKNGED